MKVDKKNIDRILRGQDVLKKTQVGYRNVERVREGSKTREVGDTWIEKDPVTGIEYQWEQLKGYRRKTVAGMSNLMEAARIEKFKNCPHDECKCKKPSRLDEKFNKLEGRCSECHFENNTKMQLDGTFDTYVQTKVESNYVAWRKEAFADLDMLKDQVGNLTYHNTDGTSEVWNANSGEIKARIEKDFMELINRLDEKYNYKESNDEKEG